MIIVFHHFPSRESMLAHKGIRRVRFDVVKVRTATVWTHQRSEAHQRTRNPVQS